MKFKAKLTTAAVLCCLSTPILAGPCDGLNSDLQGICNAFCIAKNCGSPMSKGSANSCNVLKNNYLQKAGSLPPCLSTTIAVCPSTLGLKAGGNARSFTITNTGSATAMNVAFNANGLPADASISSNGCEAVSPGGTCTVTVTPGSTPSAPADGITTSPTPVVLSLVGDNTNVISTTANIVTYGSVYQSGFVYAIDDTTPVACTDANPTASIGGKAITLTNQTPAFPNGVRWSPYNAGSPNNDNIPGIYETSVPPSAVCDGKNDGQCDSGQIVLFYPAVNPATYAAGICSTLADGGNTDWYLPAMCEMSTANIVCSPGTPNMNTNLSILRGSCTGSACLSGIYWSSTESSVLPKDQAWNTNYNFSGAITKEFKDTPFRVRCSRALSL